ncbi:MAG: DUF2339 domain-containing protein, partial [Alphaproteobacteria bacterium]|nr:DUF2339 domain-containing protein [Alphaproteobacteria bacterium]
MDWDDAIPWFFLLYLAPFVLAARSLVVSRRLRQQVATLADKVAMLDHRLFRLDERIAGTSPEAPATEAAAPAPPAAPAAQPVEATPAAPPTPTDEPERPPLAAAAPAASPREAARAFEERLVENWLVWVGGVALALGGAFLVKLSIDYGLLTPPVRIVLAVLLGLGLCAGSEWVTRREAGESENGTTAPSYVPQALAAGGAATVFAAVYAAYQLYGLIGATTAFVLLPVTAGATVALSLRQGVLVAALGLAGAYLVPALVVSDAPRALPLFLYLAFVTAGVLAVLRHRGWWWLAAPTLLGAFGWTMVWLGFAPA